MVFTRAQSDTLSREKLVEELIECSNIADQIQTLLVQWLCWQIWKVAIRINYLKELQFFISQSCHKPRRKYFEQCSVYIRRKMLEINPVPHSINNVELEELVCETLSLTGTKVKPDVLDACYSLKKTDQMIIKFKNRKQRINMIFKWKELKSKGNDLIALQFGWSLFINDSMCFKNQVPFYKCWQLKNFGKIFSYWF